MSRDARIPHHFLVPVDHSDSPKAAQLAADLARTHGGTLTLLGSVPLAMPAAAVDGPAAVGLTLVAPEDQSELDRLARERLDEYAARLGGDLDVRTAIGRGTLQEAVEHELKRRDYDMVVVSATHDGWFGHLSHEHALHKLLRDCMVPVLVVPQAAAEAAHEEAA